MTFQCDDSDEMESTAVVRLTDMAPGYRRDSLDLVDMPPPNVEQCRNRKILGRESG